MKAFFRALAFRMAIRPAIVLTSAGAASSFGASFHDLRSELPNSGEYKKRNIENITGVIYHHSATNGKSIKNIAEFHTEIKKWPAIGYHYAIGYDGVIYILNDVSDISYHSQGYNSKNIGVVFIGNYQDRHMSEDLETSFIMLNEYLRENYNLKHAWYHGQTKATACPGKNAIKIIKPYLYGDHPRR